MRQATRSSAPEASNREALQRRAKQMYAWFNRALWEKCFSLLDPKLVQQANVQLSSYADRMVAFQQAYGSIQPWHTRISLHLEASSTRRDPRPFAYVYVVWQDDRHEFHMFRERWVKDGGRWFTRVVGLVPDRQEAVQTQD